MWSIESTSSLGRIAVPPFVAPGFAVFCTTRDFPGFLTVEASQALLQVVNGRVGEQVETLATCNQVHGASVTRVTHAGAWRECDSCDALFASQRRMALGIKIADCLPVTMIDAQHHAMGNVHSGWRGAVQHITAAAIDALTRETAFDAATAQAYLGPSIRVCCFEVGEEVAAQFEPRFVDRSREKPHVDLVAFTTDVLRERGLADERISDSGLCTRCPDSIFHSYRRDGKGGGRNLQIAAQ